MEQEFNTGTPPRGEAGMCVVQYEQCPFDGQRLQFWNLTFHSERGFPESALGVYLSRDRRSESQGLPWRWATLPELLAAGLTEAEALPMLHHSQRPMTAAEVLSRQRPAEPAQDEAREALLDDLAEARNRFGNGALNIVAQALTGKQLSDEWTAETLAAAVAHLEMLAADLREPSPKPQVVAAVEVVERSPLLACAQITHRLGGWGAQ